MTFNRRDFLKLGSAGLALGTVSPLLNCPFFARPLQAAMMGTPSAKMITIFLRGGCDGVNVLIPHGDGDYNDTEASRPSIYIAPEDSIELNGFASANQGLEKLLDSDVPAENVAMCHRVAYTGQSLSHFSSSQYWENAQPGSLAEDGWINRLVLADPNIDELALPAASVSDTFQVLYRGEKALPHIPNIATYTIGNQNNDIKLLGATPSGSGDGSGMLGIYSQDGQDFDYDDIVRGTGVAVANSLDVVQDLGNYVPENGATYPSASAQGDFPNDGGAYLFFQQLRDSVQLLKETECRVCGVEIGGFDTHTNQEGRLTRLMNIIAHGMRSVYRDTEDNIWDDLIVTVISEFGRTSKENGSFGTDHGVASVMMVMGGGVNGGVYNCDEDTWEEGDLFSTPAGFPRYVEMKTDFRAILAEIVDKHFGLGDSIDDVIPGFEDLPNDSVYDALGLL